MTGDGMLQHLHRCWLLLQYDGDAVYPFFVHLSRVPARATQHSSSVEVRFVRIAYVTADAKVHVLDEMEFVNELIRSHSHVTNSQMFFVDDAKHPLLLLPASTLRSLPRAAQQLYRRASASLDASSDGDDGHRAVPRRQAALRAPKAYCEESTSDGSDEVSIATVSSSDSSSSELSDAVCYDRRELDEEATIYGSGESAHTSQMTLAYNSSIDGASSTTKSDRTSEADGDNSSSDDGSDDDDDDALEAEKRAAAKGAEKHMPLNGQFLGGDREVAYCALLQAFMNEGKQGKSVFAGGLAQNDQAALIGSFDDIDCGAEHTAGLHARRTGLAVPKVSFSTIYGNVLKITRAVYHDPYLKKSDTQNHHGVRIIFVGRFDMAGDDRPTGARCRPPNALRPRHCCDFLNELEPSCSRSASLRAPP